MGIDIGSTTLKAVQLEPGKLGFRVTRAAQQKTPVGAIRDGIIVDREAVADALKQMLRAANITATGAVCAVSGPTVIIRSVRVPKMSEASLRKSIRYEASKYISANVDDSMLDFEIVRFAPDDPDQMEIMLVATPREMVESRVETMERAGIEPVAIDTEAFAVQRALVDCNRHQYDDDMLRALVDIGATKTEVSLLSGTHFEFSRSIQIAGDSFTNALKNHLRVEATEAEQRKTEIDLFFLVEGSGDAEDLELPRAIQSMLDELLREIRRSVNYYQSQLPEGSAAKMLGEIVLSGGTSQMKGIAPYMTARLGTDVRIGDTFDNPYFDTPVEATPWLHEQAPRLSIALGLAVKEYMPPTASLVSAKKKI